MVEDNLDLRKLLSMWLAREGFQATEAGDISAVREVLQSDRPDVVLLDLGLPRQDGYAVLEELKKNETTSETPVIVVTGYSPAVHQRRCLAAGAVGFLQKPVAWRELRAAIASSLRENP